MAASKSLRLSWFSLPLLLTACAAPQSQLAAPPGPPIQERRFSEFDPRFAGKPFDFRCGDCEFTLGSNGCEAALRAPMIVRVTEARQRLLKQRCDPSDQELASSCRAEILLDLQDAEVVMPDAATGPPVTVAAEISYVSVSSEVPQFPARQAVYLFLRPNGQPDLPASHYALAICPRFARD